MQSDFKLKTHLEKCIKKLKDSECEFALAGGLAASSYRLELRTTKDLDFLISAENSKQLAIDIINSFDNMRPVEVNLGKLSMAPRMNKKSLPTLIVVGRVSQEKSSLPGLDFILPEMPWFKYAFERAQHNLIDYGYGKIPTITVEDLIIAKLFALQNTTQRYKDLDDLQNIFANKELNIDFQYLCGRMEKHMLPLPSELKKTAPKAMRTLSRRIVNNFRSLHLFL